MAFIIHGGSVRRCAGWLIVSGILALLPACSGGMETVPAAMLPLAKESQTLLAKKGMSADSAMFVRVFKEESELEVWKQRDDGRFYHFKTYPVCNWSGGLGPKLKQGDKQAPEGFYTVSQTQMNPSSQFHLAFNVGFPNAYDRSHGRTGGALMVHGDCKSAGCYAMTDALVEEIYALARESLKGGQDKFEVHAFPFRMTPENMQRHAKSEWMPFWRTLKEGYDYFELARQTPPIAVCEKRYLVNAKFQSSIATVHPDRPCPPHQRLKPDLFVAKPDAQMAAMHVMAPGKKMRNLVAEAPVSGAVVTETGSVKPSGGWLTWWGLGSSAPRTATAPQPPAKAIGFAQ